MAAQRVHRSVGGIERHKHFREAHGLTSVAQCRETRQQLTGVQERIGDEDHERRRRARRTRLAQLPSCRRRRRRGRGGGYRSARAPRARTRRVRRRLRPAHMRHSLVVRVRVDGMQGREHVVRAHEVRGRASQTLLDRRPVHAGTLQEQQLRAAQQDVQLHGRLRVR